MDAFGFKNGFKSKNVHDGPGLEVTEERAIA